MISLETFKPHPGQKRILDSPRRFIATISGVQGGKTTIGAIWLLREIYKDYEANIVGDYLLAAPTNKVLQQSTLQKFKELFPTDWGVYKEQKQVYQLKWGGNIFVRSAEEANYLEGMTLRRAWVDEAGQMKSMVWTILQARVAIAQGRVLMTSTPYAQNYYYRDIYKKAGYLNGEQLPGGDKNIEVVTWGSVENPAFPREEQERAKASMSTALYERRYEGKFTRLEGLVYPITDDLVVEPFGIPNDWKTFGGMDLGRSEPTAILHLAEDPKNKVYYVTDEYYRAGGLLKDMAQWLTSHPMSRVLADPQSAQLISELRLYHGNGEVVGADKQEIAVGIERVSKLITEGRLHIFSNCKNTIEEINVYHYSPPDPDKLVIDKPISKDDHAMDALRYAFNKPLENMYTERKEALRITRKHYRPLVTRSMWERGLNTITGYN